MFSLLFVFFFCNQKTAYELRISDWSSDVCSSDLDGCCRGNPLASAHLLRTPGRRARPSGKWMVFPPPEGSPGPSRHTADGGVRGDAALAAHAPVEIGRASDRGRGGQEEVIPVRAGAIKKQKRKQREYKQTKTR